MQKWKKKTNKNIFTIFYLALLTQDKKLLGA